MENNIFKQFKIAHIADLHLNLKKSELPQKRTLDDIINTISDRYYGIDSLIIAGDIFDMTPQTNAEVKMIYQFLVDLLNIDTLDEVIFMEGNHDLILKKSRQQEGETDITVFDTFINMLSSLNEEYSEKFIYINKSGIYQSKMHQNIKYVGYCLRDGMNLQPFEKDSNSTYIGIYHDILKEYAIEKKLPVRQDILDRKLSIDTFKNDGCDYVIAGDIHENYNFDNYFFYSGSAQQVNAGEGEYIKILKNNQIKFDETTSEKFINIYQIDTKAHKLILDKKSSLINFRNYITIDIKETYTIAEIMDMLTKNKGTIETILPSKFNIVENTIVIKLLYYYRQVESELTNRIQEFFKSILNNLESKIEVKYNGLQIESEEAIEKIQKVLEIVQDTNEDNTDVESNGEIIISDDLKSLKPIHLTNEQIQKLFEAQIDTLNNSDIDDKVKSDVINLFKSEYSNILNYHTNKFYDIKLLSIYTNSFMGLGENNIDLDIPGLVRIKGTNGVGKTTLYNMIKYVVTGNVFDGLSKNQKVKNALLLFNDSNPDIDEQIIKLSFTINQKPLEIIRKNERIWKNNVSDEQKTSINWKDYVSTVKSSVIIKTPEKTIENQEVVENLLNEWFGNTINNIVILNSQKLSEILNTTGSNLKDLILFYLGINYLSILKDNLPNIKESLNISKPNINYNNTKVELNENIQKLSEIEKHKNDFETHKTDYEEKIKSYENHLESTNNQLIALGYNSTVIELNQETLNNLQIEYAKVESFTEKQIEPAKTNIDYERKQIDLEFQEKQKEYNDFIEKINQARIKLETLKSERIQENQKSIKNEFDTKITVIETEINDLTSKRNKVEIDFNTKLEDAKSRNRQYLFEIDKIEKELESGICQSCKRPFDVDVKHIEELNQKLSEFKQLYNDSKAEIDSILQKKNNELSDFDNSINEKKDNLMLLRKDFAKQLSLTLSVVYEDLEEKKRKLSDLNDTKKNEFDICIKEKDNKISELIEIERKSNIEIQKVINHNNNVDKRNDLISRINALKSEIENVQVRKEKFDILNEKKKAYSEEIQKSKTEYGAIVTRFNQLEKEIVVVNSKINEINHKLNEYDEYKKRLVTFNVYKTIVEDKFPEAIFLYYQQFINNVLNELLEDMNFKLYWHTSGDLYMTVIENGNIVYRPVLLSSGMQNAFLGLSLVYAIHELNIKNNISHIFIDEISGQLNSGKELSNKEDVINYQSELSNLLSKFKNKSIFIIDHVIENLFETMSYEVVKSSDGSKYI